MRRVHSFLVRLREGYLLIFPLALEPGMRGHARRWTLRLGGGRCGYLRIEDCFDLELLRELASVRLPSLHGC